MAEKTMALPAEYQAGMDEADYQRLLALQIAKTNMPVPQGQMVSGHYIKPSNLQYLSNTIGNVQASGAAARAQAIRQQVMQKFLQDQQREKEAVVQMTGPQEQQLAGPPAQGETMGTEMIPPNLLKAQRRAESSQYPEVQDLAKALHERNKNLFDETAKHSSAASVKAAAAAGGDVSKMEPTSWSPLSIQDTPGGKFAVSQSTQGGQQVHGFPTAPEPKEEKFDRIITKGRIDDLVKMRDGLSQIPEVQAKLLDAYKIVKSGLANTGAMATNVTGLQAFASRFGIKAPDAVPVTQYLQNSLAPAVAEMLRTIRGPGSQSNAELIQALSRAPDANQDARALLAMIIQGIRAVERAQGEYNGMLEQIKPNAVRLGSDPSNIDSLRIQGGLGHIGTDVSRNMSEEEFTEIFKSPILSVLKQGVPTPAANPGQRRINTPKPLPAE